MKFRSDKLFLYGNLSPSEIFCLREEEKGRIKKQSSVAGACIIMFFVIQFVLGVVVALIPDIGGMFISDTSLLGVFTLVCYTASLAVPFFVVYATKTNEEKQSMYCFDKPISKASALLAIGAGLLVCTVANTVTDFLMSILSEMGIESAGGDYQIASTIDSLVIQLINIALLPALVEEFAFRFVVMQPLRRFGDGFAIVMSSLVFSLVHGNVIQIPFAFIVGLALGYFVIATKSIWVGIIIHFLNNAYSVILSYIILVNPTVANHVYAIVNAVTLVGGVICLALFFVTGKREKLKKHEGILSGREKAAAYIATVPMIITIIIAIIQTVAMIKLME